MNLIKDLSSNREEELAESIESSSKASSQCELELIEIYAQKLLKLQQSLNKNFPDAFSREQLSQTNELNNNNQPPKLKFKQLYEFKKDAVIKKLLKTIDLMNIELSKQTPIFLLESKYFDCTKKNFFIFYQDKRDRIIIDKAKQCQDLEANLEKYIQQVNECLI